MSKNNRSQIKAGAILNYLNIGIGNLIPLFYTPIMLELLGQSEYGLYKIATSTTSYLSLLSLGLGGAITRYMIKARMEGGIEAEERVYGLFLRIFRAIALLTCVVGGILVLCLDSLYSAALSDTELQRMQILVGIMVINMAIGFVSTPISSAVISHERFICIQSINILSTVVTPLLNLLLLYLGYGSVGMTTAALATTILIRIAYTLYVSRSLHLHPRYDKLPTSLVKEILVFSLWMFVSSIANQLYTATDTVIIGMIPALATVGAAIYNVGYTFPNIMFSLAQVTPTLFMPKANKMVFSGASNEQLTDLVVRVGRLQGFMVILFCCGFIAFGQPFLIWYTNPEYFDAYWVAVIIMIPNCVPLVQSAARSVLQAKNMHRFRAIVYLCIAATNAIATWFLVQYYGIIGAAIPTALSLLIGNGIVMNWYYHKKVGLNMLKFWRSMLPIFLVGGALTALTLILSQFIDLYQFSTWAACVIAFIALYASILWFFVLKKDEKEIFSAPFRKLCGRFKKAA